MASYEYTLADCPSGERARELWLQHAAGFIIFEDARQYAIDQIEATVDEATKAQIVDGINNAIYGMMMIFDGVSGALQNNHLAVSMETKVQLHQKAGRENKLVHQVTLSKGDGMCMGYHGWREGDFGKSPVALKKRP
jgi:hypothetical protein